MYAYANYTDIQQLPYGVRECSKRVYTLSLREENRFKIQRCGFGLLLNCHTTLVFVKNGNLARDFYGGGERNKQTSWIRTALK